MDKKVYESQRHSFVLRFKDLLDDVRQILSDISSGNLIELANNGVTFRIIDPFSDCDLSDVVSVENGVITLENGSTPHVNDCTNLTDLIGLLEVIDY